MAKSIVAVVEGLSMLAYCGSHSHRVTIHRSDDVSSICSVAGLGLTGLTGLWMHYSFAAGLQRCAQCHR